jgi:sigma-B regulation protein RsbU (phosphoserine phosphatase)
MGAAERAAVGSVLVADDDTATRAMIAALLRSRGLEVTEAADGTSALELLESRPYDFDAAVLDNIMPGMTGFEVIEAVTSSMGRNRPRLVLASAIGAGNEIEQALKLGADDYITKPVIPADLKRRVVRQCEMQQARRRTEAFQEQMEQELRRASSIQASLMPREQQHYGPCSFAHVYRPAEALAGDILNAIRVSDDHVGFYLADVCGHGVAASMIALWAFRFLMPTPDQTSAVYTDLSGTIATPREVAAWLDADLENGGIDSYLTMAYCLLEQSTQTLHYTLAGHPAPIVLRRDGRVDLLDNGRGPPIGMGAAMGLDYEEASVRIESGDRVFIYSDGLTEHECDGTMVGEDALVSTLCAYRDAPLAEQLEASVRTLAGDSPSTDDISLFGAQFDF